MHANVKEIIETHAFCCQVAVETATFLIDHQNKRHSFVSYIHIKVKVQGTLIHSSGQCDKCITVPCLSKPKPYTYLVHKQDLTFNVYVGKHLSHHGYFCLSLSTSTLPQELKTGYFQKAWAYKNDTQGGTITFITCIIGIIWKKNYICVNSYLLYLQQVEEQREQSHL